MKYFYHLLREYFSENFSVKLYGATLIWVAFLLVINYTYDLEDDYIDAVANTYTRSLLYFLIQGGSYYVACLFIYKFVNYKVFISDSQFWILSIVGFLILGLTRGNYFTNDIIFSLDVKPQAFNYWYKVIIRALRILLVIGPLYLVYFFIDRNNINHFYGLRNKLAVKPYFILLLLMIPLIFLASLSPSFLANYPKYLSTDYMVYATSSDISPRLLIWIYEAVYGLGFVAIELFFRGFLIFSFTRFLGPQVVLPMAVTYCVLHFGKPLGEAISSFFGGYILGVIALKTENIYGGIFVHVGIAWLMELFAYWQG